jgi:hypothetical protein
MKNFYLALAMCVFATGCATTKIQVANTYPELENMKAPDPIELEKFKFTDPSDPDAHVGLGWEEYVKFRANLEKLSGRETEWQARLNEINRQREEWRKRNKEAQK